MAGPAAVGAPNIGSAILIEILPGWEGGGEGWEGGEGQTLLAGIHQLLQGREQGGSPFLWPHHNYRTFWTNSPLRNLVLVLEILYSGPCDSVFKKFRMFEEDSYNLQNWLLLSQSINIEPTGAGDLFQMWLFGWCVFGDIFLFLLFFWNFGCVGPIHLRKHN